MRKGERERHSETVCGKPKKLICHSAMILPWTSAHCRSSRAVQVNVAAAVSQIIGSNASQRTEQTARMNTFEVGLTQFGSCCPRDSVIAFASDNKSEEVTGDTRLSKGAEAGHRYFSSDRFFCFHRSHGDQNWGMLFLQGLNKPVASRWHCVLCPIPPSSPGSRWPQGLRPRLDSRVWSWEPRPGSEMTKWSSGVTWIPI